MSKADIIIERWKNGEKQIDIANDLSVSEPYVSKVLAPFKSKADGTLEKTLDKIQNQLKRQEQLLMVLINEIRENFKIKRSIPSKIRKSVWERDGGKCIKCNSTKNLQYDHIVPYSKGGSNSIFNIQLLCESCNKIKSNKIE